MRTSVRFLLCGLLAAGCAAPQSYDLMQTPILYVDSSIDPFGHLPDELRTTRSTIFFATTRQPAPPGAHPPYSNRLSEALHIGRATVRMGDGEIDWQTLHRASLAEPRSEPIPIVLERVQETARIPGAGYRTSPLSPSLTEFFFQVNQELTRVADKEIMVYVHGTKVDFTNAAVLTAEVEHFAGRDFVSVAYAWPSHQNILSYLFGIDVRRARQSSTPLRELLYLLAEHTEAEKIHLLSYSAGGRVVSGALADMRQNFDYLDRQQLQKKFRLGSIIFAAADVELDQFLARLKAVSDFADQVVITVSDKDNALQAARRYMGGPVRAGTSEAEAAELEYIDAAELDNVSIIDVSIGQEQRGFDIVGHHYWYRHPWMSSDIIFLMRTDLPPGRRGLQTSEIAGLWYLSADYPHKIKEAARTELGDQW